MYFQPGPRWAQFDNDKGFKPLGPGGGTTEWGRRFHLFGTSDRHPKGGQVRNPAVVPLVRLSDLLGAVHKDAHADGQSESYLGVIADLAT